MLRTAFGLEIGHRDPLVAMWDVENAVLPVGTDFLEVCAPTQGASAAARFLAKRPEGGGYILVMECADLERRRARLGGLGIRVVTDLALPGFHTVQMHPRDTGGCMLEFNRTEGGGAPLGPYTPAGPQWQQAIRTDGVAALGAIEVRSRTPERLAAHWSQITESPVMRSAGSAPELRLGPVVRFRLAADDEAEGVAVVELVAREPSALHARALAAGIPAGRAQTSLRMLGLEFRLLEPG